jgi:hypothetical protein
VQTTIITTPPPTTPPPPAVSVSPGNFNTVCVQPNGSFTITMSNSGGPGTFVLFNPNGLLTMSPNSGTIAPFGVTNVTVTAKDVGTSTSLGGDISSVGSYNLSVIIDTTC